MSDISLPWDSDVSADSTGDFVTVDGLDELEERIIRRFLTNQAVTDSSQNIQGNADYIYDPNYGGNARLLVDRMIRAETIPTVQKTFLQQVQAEAEIVQNPAPSIIVTQIPQGIALNGSLMLNNGQILSLPQIEVTN